MTQSRTRQSNTSAQAPELEDGRIGVQALLDQHIDSLMEFRGSHQVRDLDLLTCRRWGRRLPDKAIAKAVSNLHLEMGNLIHQAAAQIEEQNYRSAEQAIREMEISKEERLRATSLINADRSFQTSCTSLKVAVEVFSEMNEWIIQRIDQGSDLPPEQERKLILCNAILVYELTAFCIRFIEKFQTEGVVEIRELHKRMLMGISELRQEHKRLRRQASARNIEPRLSERILCDISGRESAIDSLEAEWNAYLAGIDAMTSQQHAFNAKLPNLRLIRDNAKAQVSVLSAVSVLELVQNNILSIEAAIAQLESIQLAALSPDRVKRLLRVNVAVEDQKN